MLYYVGTFPCITAYCYEYFPTFYDFHPHIIANSIHHHHHRHLFVHGTTNTGNKACRALTRLTRFVLGPVEFISYSEDAIIVFNAHHVQYHIFADDKQLRASTAVAEAHEALKTEVWCTAAIKDWCSLSTVNKQCKDRSHLAGHSLPSSAARPLAGVDLHLSAGSDTIKPLTVVSYLAVFTDAELAFREHIRRVTSSCF